MAIRKLSELDSNPSGNAEIKGGAIPRFLRGAMRRTAETAGEAPLRFLGNRGVWFAKKAVEDFEKHKQETPLGTAGELGGIAADVGMMAAPTPFGKEAFGARVLYGAGQGAAQHQAQNYAQTGEVRPGQAAGDFAIGTAVPYAGSKIPAFLKNLGVGSARRGLAPSMKAMKGANPVDIEYALENRLIPVTGGAEKMKPLLEAKSGAVDEQLAKMLEAKGVKLDHIGAMKKTDDVVAYLEGKSKLNTGAGKAMQEAKDQAIANAGTRASSFRQTPTGKFKPDQTSILADEFGSHTVTPGVEIMKKTPEMVPGRPARELRKLTDENARYDRTANPVAPPGATYNRILRNQIENDLSKKMGATDLAVPYSESRQELRKITPLLDVVENSAAKTPRVGLGADLLTGGVGLGGFFANPLALPAAALTIGGRRMLMTPGGGRMLYEAGRGAGADATRKAGKLGIDLARSAIFSPSGE